MQTSSVKLFAEDQFRFDERIAMRAVGGQARSGAGACGIPDIDN